MNPIQAQASLFGELDFREQTDTRTTSPSPDLDDHRLQVSSLLKTDPSPQLLRRGTIDTLYGEYGTPRPNAPHTTESMQERFASRDLEQAVVDDDGISPQGLTVD